MIDHKLAESYLRRSEKQFACTKAMLGTIVSLREKSLWDVETLWNVSCHINLLSHDLMAYMLFYGVVDDRWARRAAVRSIAVLLYEGCDDLQTMFGKEFRDACTQAGILSEVDADHRATTKQLSAFRIKYESQVKAIRDPSGAHREHDVVKFLSEFMTVEYGIIIDASQEFESLLGKLADFTKRIMKRMNEVYREKGISWQLT